LISGLAAYLTKAGQVIVPESGQGALGPALVTVGQGCEDYRSHPLFTEKMERFLEALLHHKVRFRFTQLWLTKAETLRKFVDECKDGSSWAGTWSCWQQTRHVSVAGKKRQCGICAACLLRRLSVHGAGLSEPKETYVWENLSAASFEAGAAELFLPQKEKFYRSGYGSSHLDEERMKTAFLRDEMTIEAQQSLYFIPVRLGVRAIGSLGISGARLSRQTLDAVGSLVAIAIERARAVEQLGQTEAERQGERLNPRCWIP